MNWTKKVVNGKEISITQEEISKTPLVDKYLSEEDSPKPNRLNNTSLTKLFGYPKPEVDYRQ